MNDTFKFRIAYKWLNILLKSDNEIYFKVLGINLNNLDFSKFGQDDQVNNIYNRFFRSIITDALKYYFNKKYSEIIIDGIYHDNEDSLEKHALFKQKTIRHINFSDNSIKCNTKFVEFIESDHRKEAKYPDYSHLVQFIDLITGLIVNCYHNDATNDNKILLSKRILPLLKKMTKKPYNINADYYKKFSISFFPKIKIVNFNDTSVFDERIRYDNFYINREFKIESQNQTDFFKLL